MALCGSCMQYIRFASMFGQLVGRWWLYHVDFLPCRLVESRVLWPISVYPSMSVFGHGDLAL